MGRLIVASVLDKLCEITGHWNGCWLLDRSPLKRLWYWSMVSPDWPAASTKLRRPPMTSRPRDPEQEEQNG